MASARRSRLQRLILRFEDTLVAALTRAMQDLEVLPMWVLHDDDEFLVRVADPAWRRLPLRVRWLGRKRLGWNTLFLSMRSTLFMAQEGTDEVILNREGLRAVVRRLAEIAGTVSSGARRADTPRGARRRQASIMAILAGVLAIATGGLGLAALDLHSGHPSPRLSKVVGPKVSGILAGAKLKAQPAPPPIGVLVVDSGEPSARVYLDGRPLGRGRRVQRGDLTPGVHRLSVAAPHRRRFHRKILIRADHETSVTIGLAPVLSAALSTSADPGEPGVDDR